MDFGMNMNVHELIEMVSSEDIMFQYQGVMQLKEYLTVSDEKSLQIGGFPIEKVFKRLIDILGQPVLSEFSHEIKFFVMQCLQILMDIYPTHIPHLLGQNLIENLSESMEAAAAFGLEDMNRAGIKVIEQISMESPRSLLNNAKALILCSNIFEFLDNGDKKRVLTILLNVAHHAVSEEQFNNSLVPTLPVLCQNLSLQCEEDIEKAERVSVILKRMTDSFTRFQSPVEKFDRVAAVFDNLSTIGIVEVMVNGLQDFSKHEASTAIKQQAKESSEDQLMVHNIDTNAANKRTYNKTTISNFLRILTFACKYSQQIVMQLISGGLLDTLQTMLPDQDTEMTSYTQDVLSLLDSLFPAAIEPGTENISITGSLLQLGSDQAIHSEALNSDPRLEKFQKAVQMLETEKRVFFLGFEVDIQKAFMTKLVPKVFSVYKMNLQTGIRTRCLNLIDKILHVVQPELIASSIDPTQFAQFLQIIFLSANGQQVLLSLRMIRRVQETGQMRFAVQFIRQGISFFVTQFQETKNVKQFDVQEIKPLESFPSGPNAFLYRKYENAQETLIKEIKEIETVKLKKGLNPDQKRDLDQSLQDRLNALLSLKAQVLATQRAEEQQKIKETKKPEASEKEVQKMSDLIMKEAKNIVSLYFGNGEFIAQVKAQYPQEIQIIQLQKKLAQAILEESIQHQFDPEKTIKLMQELTTMLSSPQGITNYEFTESGLLRALQQFLTVPPSQSLKEIYSEEEAKQSPLKPQNHKQSISKKDSKCLILRLKVFANAMCSKSVVGQSAKLPFLALIAQCHEVLSVNEPILFNKDSKDSQLNTVEALRQLSKNVTINLVYDPDRKGIDKEKAKTRKVKNELIKAATDDPLKLALANNDDMVEDEEPENNLQASPMLDRKNKSEMPPFQHLIAAAAKEEKSLIFFRRHRLFSELGQIPFRIQQLDNVWLLEDFLLKKLKNLNDVRKLQQHTRLAYSSGLFKQTFQNPKNEELLEEIEADDLRELHKRCLERIDQILCNAQDAEEFKLMKPDNLRDLTELILEQTQICGLSDEDLDVVFKHLARDTSELIHERELEMASGEEDQDLFDRDPNEIAFCIQNKVADFLEMIDQVRQEVFKKLKKQVKDALMEETKDPKSAPKIMTNVLPTEIPLVKDVTQSVKSVSEQSLDSPNTQKQESSHFTGKEPSLSVSQSSDVEMTDEHNLQSSSLSEDKPLDEAMKEEADLVENKIENLIQLMPGKITKQKLDEQMDSIQKSQKLMEQKIAKFKQQHIMQQIAPDKALSLQENESQDEDFMKFEIEELIQMNQGADIEIEFYFNGKRLDVNTSFYEITKDSEDPKLREEGRRPKTKSVADHIRDVLTSTGQGFSLPNYHTIHFLIKDRQKPQVLDRKDSIADLAYRIQRSKSQVHDEISINSVNLVVQQLIETEFQVLTEDCKQADAENQKNVQNIEHALKILKVLNFIHRNANLLTEQGINFLLFKSGSDQMLKKLVADDMELLSVAGHQVKPAWFRHAKIDDNMVKSIQNPYRLMKDGLSEILKSIFKSCPFLFDFETKLLYFKLVSFIGIDRDRSLFFLQNYLNQKGLQGKSDELLSGNMSFFNQGRDRDDKHTKIRKQLFKIDRSKVLEEAFTIASQMDKRCLLEIQYQNEVGTGLGPTLEFYTLFADELKKAEQGSIWINTGTDDHLFPKALAVTPNNLERTRKTCNLFKLAGTFVAKSIIDDRLIDMPLSPLMWDLVLGKKMNLFDLRRLSTHYFNTFSQLQMLANRKREVDENAGLDFDSRKRLLGSIKTQNNTTVEDFDLYFVCPTDSTIELIKGGQEEKVTLENLQDYIDLSLHYIFHETINLQIKFFKQGFSQILPIESLRPFNSDEELESLICGQLNDSEWTDFDRLMEVIMPDHGFDRNSRVFRDFIRYLTEIKATDRPQLMKFLSGSRRMHAGGFAALNPRLTVVLKKVESVSKAGSDQHLPSVSTCAKYLKIPGYSSYEVLKTKFTQAIWEGTDNFTMS